MDKEAIKQKLLPLFDDLLLEKLQNKDSRTVEILSEYLAQIISQSIAKDPKKMSHALQDVISPAIADGIADNKEQMIDALYPIMGGMISKYVTQAIKEMMETINKKIEQGFSVERYKRKLKAKLTGVSESELLLEESTDAHISAMFVIHKETGLLVSEAHLENSQIGDPHMVASMASAIKDFINDWISNNQNEKSEIQILSYGNATLYIESAGSVYIIAFLDSEPDYEQRSEINAFFALLLKKYADFFQNFNGDDSVPEVEELSERMYAYLLEHAEEHNTETVSSKKNPAKLIFAGLGTALLLYGGYLLKEQYAKHSLLKQITEQTGERLTLEETAGVYQLKGTLNNPDHLKMIEKLSQESQLREKVIPELSLSINGVAKVEKKLLQRIVKTQNELLEEEQKKYQEKLDSLRAEMDEGFASLQQRQKHLEKELTSLKDTKRRLDRLLHIKESIASALKQKMKNDSYYNEKKEVLNFASLHLFKAGETEPVLDKMEPVIKSFKHYLSVLADYKPYLKEITVYSYSDTSGNTQSNLELTRARAKNVKVYLQQLPEAKDFKLKAVGKGESFPVIVNGKEDTEASRRIEIGFELDQSKIDQEIKHLLENK